MTGHMYVVTRYTIRSTLHRFVPKLSDAVMKGFNTLNRNTLHRTELTMGVGDPNNNITVVLESVLLLSFASNIS